VHCLSKELDEGGAEGTIDELDEHVPFRYEVSPEGDEYGVVPALIVYILEYGS